MFINDTTFSTVFISCLLYSNFLTQMLTKEGGSFSNYIQVIPVTIVDKLH